MAPPGSNDTRTAQAYMGSPDSGYAILYWDAGAIQVTSINTMCFDINVFQQQADTWKVTWPNLTQELLEKLYRSIGKTPGTGMLTN